MLWLESDRLTHLLGVVTQERLDEQRGVVQNEKRQRANQPYGTAFEHMLRGVFPAGHPYRHTTIGSMEHLNAASLEDVYGWFEDYYGASNVTIALAGDIDVETAKPLMEKYYGDAPAGEPIARLQKWVPKLEGNRIEVLRDRAATGLDLPRLANAFGCTRVCEPGALGVRLRKWPHRTPVQGTRRGAQARLKRVGEPH